MNVNIHFATLISRELTGIEENYKQQWAKEMNDFAH
jgi:hypothetical protein